MTKLSLCHSSWGRVWQPYEISFGMSWSASVLLLRAHWSSKAYSSLVCVGLGNARGCHWVPVVKYFGVQTTSHTQKECLLVMSPLSFKAFQSSEHTQGSIIIMMPIFTEYHSVLKALYTQDNLEVKNLSYWTQIFTPPITEESSANHLTPWSLSLRVCKMQANNVLHLHKFGESSLQ